MTERIIKICIYTPEVTTAGPWRSESYTEAKRRQDHERHQAGPLPLAGCSCPSCHAAAEADRHATPEAADDERFKIWVADQDHADNGETDLCPPYDSADVDRLIQLMKEMDKARRARGRRAAILRAHQDAAQELSTSQTCPEEER